MTRAPEKATARLDFARGRKHGLTSDNYSKNPPADNRMNVQSRTAPLAATPFKEIIARLLTFDSALTYPHSQLIHSDDSSWKD